MLKVLTTFRDGRLSTMGFCNCAEGNAMKVLMDGKDPLGFQSPGPVSKGGASYPGQCLVYEWRHRSDLGPLVSAVTPHACFNLEYGTTRAGTRVPLVAIHSSHFRHAFPWKLSGDLCC